MAFKFNAILDFKSEGAVAGMKKAKEGFQGFKDGVSKANASFGQIASGAQGGAIALAPLSAGFGFAIKDAAEFEHGMAAVQGTMLATKEEMRPLALVTKQLGAATKFSAVEATRGAMFFAQAGFDMQQIIAALPGAMDAAAAGEIDLATTTDIMASTMGAFGLEAGKASSVADTLALAASLTNTDMVGLGEALKYSASTARTAGMSLEDTASALGIMANAGLKGSMGGTALQNALLQLTKPTKEVLGLFGGRGGFNEAILDAHGNLLPFEVIIANTSKIVQKSANPLEAAGKAAQIFGLRGAKAFGAFTGQLQDTVVVNDVMIDRFKKAGVNVEEQGIHIGSVIPKLVALRMQINGAEGAARQMAEIRMSSFLGSLEQLKGATQGLSIEVGDLMLGSLTEGSKVATDAIGMLAFGFQALSMTEDEAAKMQGDLTNKNNTMFNQFGKFLPMFKRFAGGFKEGLDGVIDGVKSGIVWVKELFGSFSDSEFSAKDIGKLVAQVALIGAILAPVLAGVVAFGFVIGPMVTGISGLFGLFSGGLGMITGAFTMASGAIGFLVAATGIAAGPLLLIIAAIIAVAVVVGTVFYNMMGGIEGMKMAVQTFAAGFMTTFGPIISVLMDELEPTFLAVKGSALELFDTLFGGTSKAGTDFTSFGEVVGNVAGFIVTAIVPVIKFVGLMITGFLSLLQLLATAGKGFLNFIGIGNTDLNIPDQAQFDKFKNLPDNVLAFPSPGSGNEVAAANNQLGKETLNQSALVQPPSANELSSLMNSQSESQSRETTLTHRVVLEGSARVRGNDLNIALTRAQVDQSQLNGRSPDPITKRRSISNGSQFRAD